MDSIKQYPKFSVLAPIMKHYATKSMSKYTLQKLYGSNYDDCLVHYCNDEDDEDNYYEGDVYESHGSVIEKVWI
jgi:hypothetical protein